jgi:regulatory protein
VTAIRNGGRGTHRVVTLSDGREFAFSDEAIERVGLKEGAEVDGEVLEALAAQEERVTAHDAALRLLDHRPRSQSEMRTRLAMRGISPATIDAEIERLDRSGLLDDESFARAWVEDRQRHAPRGRRMLRYELLGRGIDPDQAEVATSEVDDLETAVNLARNKARTAPKDSWEAFLGKVGPFLARRGFDYSIATEATRTAWAELQADTDTQSEARP